MVCMLWFRIDAPPGIYLQHDGVCQVSLWCFLSASSSLPVAFDEQSWRQECLYRGTGCMRRSLQRFCVIAPTTMWWWMDLYRERICTTTKHAIFYYFSASMHFMLFALSSISSESVTIVGTFLGRFFVLPLFLQVPSCYNKIKRFRARWGQTDENKAVFTQVLGSVPSGFQGFLMERIMLSAVHMDRSCLIRHMAPNTAKIS